MRAPNTSEGRHSTKAEAISWQALSTSSRDFGGHREHRGHGVSDQDRPGAHSPPLTVLRRHPAAVILPVLLVVPVLGGIVTLTGIRNPPFAVAIGLEAVLAAVVLAAVWTLGWWREAGLSDRWRERPVALLAVAPVVLVWLLAAPLLPDHGRWGLLPRLVLLVALVGLAEETMCRGLLLYSLRRLGPLTAGAGSAAVFALLHFTNVFAHPVGPVSLQVVSAFQIGLLFAAVRMRAGSIWPVVGAHALIDLGVLLVGPLSHPPASWTLTVIGSVVLNLPFGLTGLGLLTYDQLEGRVPWRRRPSVTPS